MSITLHQQILEENNQAERNNLIRHTCLSNRFFELIVFPTEQCNFRCTYCYEDFAIGSMKEPVINGIRHLLDKRASSLNGLKISYFGGEPLLNMRAVRAISSHAQSLAERHDFKLSGNATTNGFLLDTKLMQELIALQCSNFQISLDGWRSVHDETRRSRRQSGTFDKIWANLLALANSSLEFDIILRVHMTPQNRHSLEELVENINTHLGDHRFQIMFKSVGNWGGLDPDHPEVFGYGAREAIELHQRLVDLAGRVTDSGIDETGGNVTPLESSKARNDAKAAGLPPICYAAKANSLAVRANGRINKCTVALSNPANDIGFISEDGSLQIDPEKLSFWIEGAQSLDRRALSCPASRIAF